MQSDLSAVDNVSIVIIGRNEGDRLVRCLKSLANQTGQVIYVDSSSTDNSVANARNLGAEVLSLDMSIPFTAARARNEGFERVRTLYPHTSYVQFVDGDCEMDSTWIANAVNFLDKHPQVVVVCGRRRERHPESTVYNMLCDIEWDTPVGESKACGGDALVRFRAFEQVKGFRASLIAGEEPELCIRLRAAGWKIWRIDAEMTLHDAAMTRFGQWWKRSIRTGYGTAEGTHLYGTSPERHWIRESRRSLIWGVAIPLLTLILMVWFKAWSLLLLFVYPAQVVRLAVKGDRTSKENWWRALFLVLGKFPEAIGQLNFLYNTLTKKTARLIEYK